ncbi:MAG: alpha/beta fold hydrolase [Burkholderiaceae bacterium]
MIEPSLQFAPCAPQSGAPRRLAYWQWGDAQAAHAVVCVHGLTRQGRDFDVLAQVLCTQAPQPVRVVCVDVAGRGQSDWLVDPTGYQIPTYVADLLGLVQHLHAQAPLATLDWVGTSMGGLIGIGLCGSPLPVPDVLPLPVRRLVLNDVGPRIEWASLQRIAQYVGRTGTFASVQQAADAMWPISTGFGPHTPAQWLALSQHMVKPLAGQAGMLTLHYDPAIGEPFRSATPESTQASEAALWALYDAITAQTLLLRGAESDLLSAQTAREMGQRGPCARLVEFAGVGHAPTLVAQGQSQAVADFLFAAPQ